MFEKEVRKAIDDSQEFIRKNLYNSEGKPKKWFINVNHKEAFIKLHPEGGTVDKQHNITKTHVDYKETELRDLKSSKTMWYGLFDSFHEAVGFAAVLAKVYIIQTDHKLRITACRDDIVCEPLDPF